MTEPRLASVDLARFLSDARRARWSCGSPGMTLDQLRQLGISRKEARYLAARGVAVFDPPLPDVIVTEPLRPRSPRPSPRRRRPRGGPRVEERSKPRTPTVERACMTCGGIFASEGPHHRMCDRCRRRAADVSPFEPNEGAL